MEVDSEWVTKEAMPYGLRAKILALKVCRNRCLAHAEAESALEIAQPVIRMFSTVLRYEGSFTEDTIESDKYVLLLCLVVRVHCSYCVVKQA